MASRTQKGKGFYVVWTADTSKLLSRIRIGVGHNGMSNTEGACRIGKIGVSLSRFFFSYTGAPNDSSRDRSFHAPPVSSKLHILDQTLVRVPALHAGKIGKGAARDACKVATIRVAVGQGIMLCFLMIVEVGLTERVLSLVVVLMVMAAVVAVSPNFLLLNLDIVIFL